MAEELVTFDRDDLQTLKQMAQWYRTTNVNPQSRPATSGSFLDTEEQQSSDVYIARPQSTSGIPALDEGTGTGTGSVAEDRPGYGDCDIFTIKYDSDGYRLEQVPNFVKRVFNFSSSIIPYEYFSIQRTKYGQWIPASSGSGGVTCEALAEFTNYNASTTQVLGHSFGSCFWVDTQDCSTPGTGTGSV